MRFAQVIDRRVCNPCDGPDLEAALGASFNPLWVSVHRDNTPWTQVPDDAPSGAILDDNGGWSLPESAAVPQEPSAPAPVSVETLAARVDAMTALLNRIADHLGVQTEAP